MKCLNTLNNAKNAVYASYRIKIKTYIPIYVLKCNDFRVI